MAANVQDAIMLFGDSLTQGGWEPNMNGFGQRLAHVYARKLDVINRGLSGYNTEWGIPVFEQCFAKQHEQQHVPKVRILTIWFGANDAAIKPSAQHIPLPKFISNLTHLVRMVTSSTSPYHSPFTRIILITPPPVNTYQREAELQAKDPPKLLDRTFETTRKYAEAVVDVGKGERIPVVDIWNALYDAAGRDERALSRFLWDGLHLNAAGYEILYDAIIDTIREKYPELHYDKLQPVFNGWADINWDDPAQTLLARQAIIEH
jgi:lysophospholipase L1-like esterase